MRASEIGSVLIITKDAPDEAATSYAQGGIAAALGLLDNPEKHYNDTIDAGAGLCDPDAVKILVNEGVTRVKELIKSGMEFTRSQDGALHLGKEGGHGEHRVVHAHDHTGRAIEKFLLNEVKNNPNIKMMPGKMAVDLITEHHLKPRQMSGNVFGAYVLDESTGEILPVLADYVILATGGAGRVYPYTTNPPVSTGDGVAMAFRAGCRVRNMEFFQFHPTSLFSNADPAFLITEALRGFGAKLTNSKGEPFMHKFDERKELAPRDIVARAIDSQLKTDGSDYVYLDVTHIEDEKTKEHFPLVYNTLKEKFGIDITKEAIPVVPAAHYMCGGINVNHEGRTDINFLYAIGETASTGVHGGNRLASNSLAEGLVFAHRAFLDIKHRVRHSQEKQKSAFYDRIPAWDKGGTANLAEWVLVAHDLKEIKNIMWDYVGIMRSRLRLQRALRRIDLVYEEIIDFYNRTIPTREILELRNLALIAQIIIRSALSRKESRGLHYMSEYPETREPSRKDTILEPLMFKQRFTHNNPD